MGDVILYVMPKGERWFVQLNGKQFGPCPNRETAVNVATSVAKKVVTKGCHAQVMIEGPQRFRQVWSSRRMAALA
jgi:hypothetical protein